MPAGPTCSHSDSVAVCKIGPDGEREQFLTHCFYEKCKQTRYTRCCQEENSSINESQCRCYQQRMHIMQKYRMNTRNPPSPLARTFRTFSSRTRGQQLANEKEKISPESRNVTLHEHPHRYSDPNQSLVQMTLVRKSDDMKTNTQSDTSSTNSKT